MAEHPAPTSAPAGAPGAAAALLAQLTLGHSPLVDTRRQVCGTRLTCFPESPAAADGAAFCSLLAGQWPAGAERGSADALPAVSLNLAGEALLDAVLLAAAAQPPGAHVMIEVPAFMAADPAREPALRALRRGGTLLALKGRALAPLPPPLLELFSHVIVEPDDERSAASLPPALAGGRRLVAVHAGTRSTAAAAAAFAAGGRAVIGWPWEDEVAPAGTKTRLAPDVRTVLALIDGVEREHPVSRLEPLFKRDPALGLRLLRLLNAPGLGLSVEVTSFGHALMLLGYRRVKRWLALLLATSVAGADARVLVHAAVSRGLLMEALAAEQGAHGAGGDDAERRGEMFICGLFSMLPRLLRQPLPELLASVPVPERVQQAVRDDSGPHAAALRLVLAIESEALFDIRDAREALMLEPAPVNRALLSTLATVRDLLP